MKDSFIFYRSFFDAICELKNDEKLQIFNAICELGLNQNETEMKGIPKAMFSLIKPQLEANNKRYKNGTKGGRPKTKTKPKQNQTETKPKANKNVNVNVNENDNDNKKENKKEKDFAFIENPEWKKLFSKYVDYRDELKKPLKPVSYKAGFDKLVKLSGDDLAKASEIVGNTIANGWQGLFELEKRQGRLPQKKDTLEKTDEMFRNYLRENNVE